MTIQKKSSDVFYRDLDLRAMEKRIPSRVMFELTYRCNLRCIHCYMAPGQKKKELSTGEVFSVLDQLRDLGCFRIGFTGGEPLLRRDIFEILEHAKKCGMRISLLTNGLLIDAPKAKRLAALGSSLNRVDVSVLGATPQTFEKITGKKGSFRKILQSIRLLKAQGVTVQLKATLLKPNEREFVAIKTLADDLDCLFRYCPSLSCRVDGDPGPLQYQVEPAGVARIKQGLAGGVPAVLDDVHAVISPEKIGRKNLFHCGAGRNEVTISPFGEMNFCLEIRYPQFRVLETSVKDCWERLKGRVDGLKLPKEYLCRDCVLAGFCHWCPAKAWLLKKDFFTCDAQSRRLALAEAQQSSLWKVLGKIWKRQSQRFV